MWLRFKSSKEPDVLVNAERITNIQLSEYGNKVIICFCNSNVVINCNDKNKTLDDICEVIGQKNHIVLTEGTSDVYAIYV